LRINSLIVRFRLHKKICATCEIGHSLFAQKGSLYVCGHSTAIGPKGWGTDMRIRIIQFSLKAFVAVGIALLGVNAIGGRVAYSAVERAWAAGKEMLAKPLRPPGPKSEFRLGDYQKLRTMMLGK
jgi:hypothetical protein